MLDVCVCVLWGQAYARGEEMPQNLLCLSNIVHDLWGKARLAFEPVEMAADISAQ